MNETELFFTDGESVTEAERGYVAHKIILVEIKELWREDTLK